MSKSKSKSKSRSLHKLKNWSEYDASLKQRESITFWLTPEVVQECLNQTKTGGRRSSNRYSDTAIKFMVTIQSMFGLAGGQTEGFVESILQFMDLDLPANSNFCDINQKTFNCPVTLISNSSGFATTFRTYSKALVCLLMSLTILKRFKHEKCSKCSRCSKFN